MIQNAKISGYCFYINTNIQGDIQICISVPLTEQFNMLFGVMIVDNRILDLHGSNQISQALQRYNCL